MLVDEREKIIKQILRSLAITRYDIEHCQSINDYSLNIHSENYWRDLFNELYKLQLKNVNFKSNNAAYIDLVDSKKKRAIQITTTRTKGKIENTLKVLQIDKYKGYKIQIFYLLTKPNPTDDTCIEINKKYNIDLKKSLFDYTDIIKEINNLERTQLEVIYKKYFKEIEKKYSNEIVLDLVIQHLLKEHRSIQIDYNDEFGSTKVNEKLKLNNINDRTSSEIQKGLDYNHLLESLSKENILVELEQLVINNLYKNILKQELKIFSSDKNEYTIFELHAKAKDKCDFNKIIYNKLHTAIKEKIAITDWNSMAIVWVIIAYFFELCDIGIKK